MTNDEEDSMSELYQSLSHSKWDCKYHVVFVPKRRRKAIFGQARRQLGAIFHALARQKECQIIEGHLMPDHVHICIAIPPKHPVVSVIGFLKGKSAIAIARLSGNVSTHDIDILCQCHRECKIDRVNHRKPTQITDSRSQ